MKRWRYVFVALTLLILVSFGKKQLLSEKDQLLESFLTPPDSIQTSVYWYWVSDNISKEGVVNDLEAMKRAGINRAFIGNIGLKDVPYGKVKMLSEEWWAILHEALKAATRLNIDIGIFNSPGWSQSGGPWIKSTDAMRYLISSETEVIGPSRFSGLLKKPIELFQDVKVIAFPVAREYDYSLNQSNAKITSLPVVIDLLTITDEDIHTGIKLPETDSFVVSFESSQPFLAKSLTVRSTEQPFQADFRLEAENKMGNFETISQFEINRSKTDLNVGFDSYAPVVISFPDVTSNEFRLIVKAKKSKTANGFKNTYTNSGIAEIKISADSKVERYSEKTLAKMHPTPLPYWDAYLWREQPEVEPGAGAIDPTKIKDITQYLSADGTLNWQVPEGRWIILRMGMTPTGTKNSPASPEATGYEVDKMSKELASKHFYAHMGEVLRRIPEADRKSFKVVVQDSYEMGGQNFTDGFMDEFKQKFGYDPLPFLPVYQGRVVQNQRTSDRFLWDMRRMVADKVAYDYVGGLRDVSHKNGLTTWLENYGHWGFPSEFLMYGGQSDEISGEFWSEGTLGDIENRAATSCGHIYGKTKISAESNTCAGMAFSRYPATIKQRGDRFFAEGINNTLLHVFISQPYEDRKPGLNAWFGNEFNRKNTWFSQMDLYTQYLKRTNFMLQQGLNVADVAYFIGEDAPKMTGTTDPALPIGYQFDYMNAEVIEKFMTVRNGLITLPHGTQYKLLVLPKLETMRPEVLSKIVTLVKQGAVVLGPAPKRSPSLQNQPLADQQVANMAKELWGEVDGNKVKYRKYGEGMVLNGMNMKEAFQLLNNVPDCKLPEDNTIHFGHRTTAQGEIYFLSNQTAATKEVTPEFRVTGLQPELWEATTGEARLLLSFKQMDRSTAVPLKLAPYESVFVVFRKPNKQISTIDLKLNYPDPVWAEVLSNPWRVFFDSKQGGPHKEVVFDTLQNWANSKNEKIKYYSGTANYINEFNIPALSTGEKIRIDLGSLTAMAKVKINGVYAGGVWTAPYQLDVSKLVKQGNNILEVEVVNTWVNRLIGDSKLPENKRITWCNVNPYKPQSPLQASGLMGPVRILKY